VRQRERWIQSETDVDPKREREWGKVREMGTDKDRCRSKAREINNENDIHL